jgi:2',3'-cyclic-nucleotide 2'-phosphodiesterase/3'-nucleotidase
MRFDPIAPALRWGVTDYGVRPIDPGVLMTITLTSADHHPDKDRAWPTARLRILATTDLHMNLRSHDYFTDRPAPQLGLVRTATLIRRARAETPNSLLFDNGDVLQGNPMSDNLARRFKRGERNPHPMIAAMNALGYDAATPGNHEFNYGLPFLNHALGKAGFPVVSANIGGARQADGTTLPNLWPPFALLDRMILTEDGQSLPIRVGVIGFAPPQIAQWDRVHVMGQIDLTDIVAAARHHVPRMVAAGAEIVVALCHSGIGAESHEDGMENAAVPLALVDGIDALILGHTHQVFPGPATPMSDAVDPSLGLIHGKPAVMAGCNGSHLGVIDMILSRVDGRWRRQTQSVHVVPIADRARPRVPADPDLTRLVQDDHRRLLRHIRRPVGETRVPLHSFFSLIRPDAALQVVADAQRARATAILAGTPLADLPLLSAVAPFKAGGRGGPDAYLDIGAGVLCRRHASELYLYPNGFTILCLTGAAISDWLERSASVFLPLAAGITDQPLIDPDFAAYNFDLLDGLRYVIDPTRSRRTDGAGQVIDPAARRVSQIIVNDRPLDPAESVLVATNSYRAGGGGGFHAARTAAIAHQTDTPTSEIVLDYLRRNVPVAPVVPRTWVFASHPGTGAWLDIGPGAAAHAARVPGLTQVASLPSGFLRYALRF